MVGCGGVISFETWQDKCINLVKFDFNHCSASLLEVVLPKSLSWLLVWWKWWNLKPKIGWRGVMQSWGFVSRISLCDMELFDFNRCSASLLEVVLPKSLFWLLVWWKWWNLKPKIGWRGVMQSWRFVSRISLCDMELLAKVRLAGGGRGCFF